MGKSYACKNACMHACIHPCKNYTITFCLCLVCPCFFFESFIEIGPKKSIPVFWKGCSLMSNLSCGKSLMRGTCGFIRSFLQYKQSCKTFLISLRQPFLLFANDYLVLRIWFLQHISNHFFYYWGNFIEIRLQHRSSTVNLLHIFRTVFPKNISRRLFL